MPVSPKQLDPGLLTETEHSSLDHTGIPGAGGGSSPVGGTGAAGSVTYTSSQQVNGAVDATDITINGGVTLDTSGLRAMHLRSTSSITNNGTIDVTGQGLDSIRPDGGIAAGGGGGGGDGAGTGDDGGDRASIFLPGGGGAGGGPNANGSNGGTTVLAFLWLADVEAYVPWLVAPGCYGGNGGASGGVGGDGGGIVILEAQGDLTEGTINADGDDGANGSIGTGGGGGGGGGTVVIIWGGTRTAGTITVNGGAGGTGSGGGDGGSGADGIIRRVQAAV